MRLKNAMFLYFNAKMGVFCSFSRFVRHGRRGSPERVCRHLLAGTVPVRFPLIHFFAKTVTIHASMRPLSDPTVSTVPERPRASPSLPERPRASPSVPEPPRASPSVPEPPQRCDAPSRGMHEMNDPTVIQTCSLQVPGLVGTCRLPSKALRARRNGAMFS